MIMINNFFIFLHLYLVFKYKEKSYYIIGEEIMYNLIERYMRRITIEEVNDFALKKNIYLSDEELLFTFEFIKKNWNQILSNPNSLNLDRYKNKYSEENFNKIQILFKEYYSKYHRFL